MVNVQNFHKIRLLIWQKGYKELKEMSLAIIRCI